VLPELEAAPPEDDDAPPLLLAPVDDEPLLPDEATAPAELDPDEVDALEGAPVLLALEVVAGPPLEPVRPPPVLALPADVVEAEPAPLELAPGGVTVATQPVAARRLSRALARITAWCPVSSAAYQRPRRFSSH
jgi:hypothetical protein